MRVSALRRLGIDDQARAPSTSTSASQTQTEKAFSFKWNKRETYESAGVSESAREWLLERYCGRNESLIDVWLAGGRKIIFDAGCGAGVSAMLFFGDRLRDHDYLGVDISNAVEIARQRFAEAKYPGDFLQMSLADAPIPDTSVDIIFSEGVLHHTDDPKQSLKHLARKLVQGGRLLFYVYAKKAVVREFTDDLIREHLRPMSDEDAWRALEPLTKIGVALGELNVEIEVPEPIPFLGIPAGRIDVQRFVYWNICKLYYRPNWTLEEMQHVNFDWFRPLNCHRQTPNEVREWCQEADLEIERLDVQEAGITVVARRTSQMANGHS